jgi:hypothetical protein
MVILRHFFLKSTSLESGVFTWQEVSQEAVCFLEPTVNFGFQDKNAAVIETHMTKFTWEKLGMCHWFNGGTQGKWMSHAKRGRYLDNSSTLTSRVEVGTVLRWSWVRWWCAWLGCVNVVLLCCCLSESRVGLSCPSFVWTVVTARFVTLDKAPASKRTNITLVQNLTILCNVSSKFMNAISHLQEKDSGYFSFLLVSLRKSSLQEWRLVLPSLEKIPGSQFLIDVYCGHFDNRFLLTGWVNQRDKTSLKTREQAKNVHFIFVLQLLGASAQESRLKEPFWRYRTRITKMVK